MTSSQAEANVRRLYGLTVLFGILGAIAYYVARGFRPALALLLGAAISLGNLWLFNYLSVAIAPSTSESKPWAARAFISRYLILLAAGYVITKALGVEPLPVVLGLFASTAAVLLDSIVQVFRPAAH